MRIESLVHRLALAVLIVPGLLRAQTSDPLLQRLRRAELATTLTREGVNPFYLKIDVQLYDAKGKPSETGTIEEWWAGGSTEKTVFTTPSYTATQVRKGDEILRSAVASYTPSLLQLLLDQVIDPMPSWPQVADSKAVFQKLKLGGAPLECIVLTLHSDPDGLPPEYCFDPGKDSLRLTFQYGNRVTIRNGVGTFQQKEVPMDVMVRNGDLIAATGHISALMSRPVPATEVETDGLPDRIILTSPLVVAGRLVQRRDPVYPEEAKRQHLAGVVVLEAVIGIDGHIHELRLVSSPSPLLTDAAKAAISQWVYAPYTADGVPTKVLTTISVHFTFQPR